MSELTLPHLFDHHTKGLTMNLSRKILAGAIFALLPLTGALACNTNAWNGGETGNPVEDDPDANVNTNNPENGAVKRYAGRCGLAPASGAASFVEDNSPGGIGAGTEGTYRARVYFFSGLTSGAPRVLEAFTADDGGGSSLFGAAYDRGAGQVTFTVAGAAVPAMSINVAENKWYSLEVFHQTGQALQASIVGANTAVADTAALTSNSGGTVVNGGVGSVRLGNVNGAALGFSAPPAQNNNFGFSVDEFDSTRSATPIGRLCRGDANNDAANATGDVDLSALDAGAIISEALGQAVAPGQPDANEDGRVTALDAGLVISMRFAGKKCN